MIHFWVLIHSFATTCAGQPIHLWDAYNGKLRASMKGLNQYEEIISAFSITIDSTNSHLLAGYNKSFKVFDLEHPNKELVHFNTCGNQLFVDDSNCFKYLIKFLELQTSKTVKRVTFRV